MTTATPSNGSIWPARVRIPPSPTKPSKAYHNLAPRVRACFEPPPGSFRSISTRWHDVFGYGQVKTELKLGHLPIRPYLSMRFVGDTRGTIGLDNQQSDSAISFGKLFHLRRSASPRFPGMASMGWFEAGEAVKYLTNRNDVGAMIPDYRGGVAYAKGFGHLMNSTKGLFFETNEDGVFVSRFQNDMLLLLAEPRRLHLRASRRTGRPRRRNCYWNFNGTADRLHQYWANYVETGPGMRFRFRDLPKSLLFSVNFLRGAYTVNRRQSAPSQLLRSSSWILVCIYALSCVARRFARTASPRSARRRSTITSPATIRARGRRSSPPSDSRAPTGGPANLFVVRTSRPDRYRNGSSASSRAASWCWKAKTIWPRRSAFARARNTWWCVASSTSARPSCRSSGKRRSKFRSSSCPRTRQSSPPNAGSTRR